MNEIPFLIPLISALSSFLIIFVVRFIDVFEREPYKLLFINFLFGIFAYLLSVISVSSTYSFFNFNNQILNLNEKFIFISILLSSGLMLIYQLIFSFLSLILFKKDFDTMPDFIIYFSTIGIGYNFGEVFFVDLLNKTNNQFFLEISENLYFSSFFSGSTLPFLMAGIGAGIYLNKISKKNKKFEKLRGLSVFFILISLITQIIFYSMNSMITLTSTHSPSEFINIVNQVKYFANSLSITILIGSVGFAVMFDAYIISNFLEKVLLSSEKKFSKIVKFSNFINPFLYLSISKLKYFSAFKNDKDINEKVLKTITKLAFKNFNDPENSSIYISEAYEILEKP